MNSKKILTLFLAVVITLTLLCSCAPGNGGGVTEEDTTDAAVDTAPVKVEKFELAELMFGDVDKIPSTPAENFSYTVADGAVTVTGYLGENDTVCVPAVIEGLPVQTVGEGAFADLEGLQALILPDSITELGAGILAGCDALCILETPLLGEYAGSEQYLGYLFGAASFRDNPRDVPPSLRFLRLCGGEDTLDAYALYDCNDLQAVDLGGEIKVLEKFSMYGCASLKAVFHLDKVEKIEADAMMQCSSLLRAELGDGLTSVGLGAFEGCSSLTLMRLPFVGGSRTENTYLGYIFGAEHPDFSKGYYPRTLQRIELSSACTSLGNYAFYQCERLKEISLGDGLETIGVRAFYGCISLWSVSLPDALKSIGESAFFACDSLLSVAFGEGLEEMGVNAFYQCDSLTSVALPMSLKKLPASAFAGCIALKSVDLGGVLQVGAQAFRHCDAITSARAREDVRFGAGNESVMNALQSAGK